MNRKLTVRIEGPTGSGKTLLSQIITEALRCGVHSSNVTPWIREIVNKNGVRIVEKTTPPPVPHEGAMEVLANPHAKNEFSPEIRSSEEHGFSVRHGNIKGAWRTKLVDALFDYNTGVQRALAALRLDTFKPEKFPVASLPGIEAAEDLMKRKRALDIFESESRNAKEAAEKAPCACPVCEWERGQADEQTRAPKYRKSAMGSLLAALAMMGDIDAMLGEMPFAKEDMEGDTLVVEPSPELIDQLAKVGLLHVTGNGRGVVAIPRHCGEEYIKELEAASCGNDVAAVKRLTVGRKF